MEDKSSTDFSKPLTRKYPTPLVAEAWGDSCVRGVEVCLIYQYLTYCTCSDSKLESQSSVRFSCRGGSPPQKKMVTRSQLLCLPNKKGLLHGVLLKAVQ